MELDRIVRIFADSTLERNFCRCGCAAALRLHIDMFRYIARSLVAPTPLSRRAQLDQHRQMFDTAGKSPALTVNMRIVTPLLFPGNLGGRFVTHMRLYDQRRRNTRPNRPDAPGSRQGIHFRSGFRRASRRWEAGYVFHGFKSCQTDSSCFITLSSRKDLRMQNPCSQLHPIQPERIADHRHRTETHRGGGDHRREQ